MKNLQYGLPLVGKRRKAYDNLEELLESVSEQYKDNVAFISEEQGVEQQIAYQEFGIHCRRSAGVISGKVRQGDRVAIFMSPSHQWIEAFFAVTILGAVAVLLPSEKSAEFYCTAMKKINCVGIIYDEKTEKIVREMNCIYEVPIQYRYEELSHMKACTYEKPVIKRETPAAIFFTSGTTGENKAVVASHRNIVISSYNPATRAACDRDGIYLALLPLYHIFGLTCGLLTFLYGGMTIVVNDSNQNLFRNIMQYKPCFLALVPSMARALSGIVVQQGINKVLPNLDALVVAGAATESRILDVFMENEVTVFQGYGTTECGIVSSTCGEKFCANSIGTAFEHNEFKIVDHEIWVKGDTVFLGYLNPAYNAEVFEGEWFKTGDLGRYDNHGNIYITGRKKFVIVTEDGENISPEEVEEELYQIPYIIECLVYESKGPDGAVVIGVDIFTEEAKFEQCKAAVLAWNETQPVYRRIRHISYRNSGFEKNQMQKMIRNRSV
ncbi:MAG: class I adenylate-forming enzyme family protein [Eubacteriales bacterium]